MIEKTETHIVMQAEVKNDSGKLMANGIAKCVLIKNRKSNENARKMLITKALKQVISTIQWGIKNARFIQNWSSDRNSN